MTTTESNHAPTDNVRTRPTQTLISTESTNPEAITVIAITERVMDGTLPFVWTRAPKLPKDFPYPFEDPSRYLPSGCTVTRKCESLYRFTVFAEGPEFALTLSVSSRGAAIDVAAADHDTARRIGESIAVHFPIEPQDPNEVGVLAWKSNRSGEVSYTTKDVTAPKWSEVASNYATQTRLQLERLMGLEAHQDQRGRVILWHGPPGTGKSTAIRALMRQWTNWCRPELLVDPESVFADPHYLYEVMTLPSRKCRNSDETSWRLLIAEDADRYLRPQHYNEDNAPLDRLLNVADGILGHGCKLMILLTTNHNVASLHPALIRPGRCLAITEFEKFDRASARKWINGRAPSPSGPVSLAELYELVDDEKRLGVFEGSQHGQYL